jgi:hypothetical protein
MTLYLYAFIFPYKEGRMRDERNVVEKHRAEAPRLEELSDEDLEAVAGGVCKDSNNGTYTSWFASDVRVQYTHSNYHSDSGC